MSNDMIRIFIGFDAKEAVAYNVLSYSIIENAGAPVAISPIRLSHLKGIFNRPRDPKQSTEFSFSRFLVPYLSGYEGHSIFVDSDCLLRSDLTELWDLRSDDYAVQVVKHDYTPTGQTKFLGNIQSAYPKKNWSSVIIFNNSRCRALSPEFVGSASGLELHQFKWLDSDDEIGELPREWNHLVGEYPANPDARLVHFTLGGPWWAEYSDVEYSNEWTEMLSRMQYSGR